MDTNAIKEEISNLELQKAQLMNLEHALSFIESLKIEHLGIVAERCHQLIRENK